MGNTQTIPAKSFDASRLPSGLTTAENAVIFNIGACDASCFGPGAVVTFTLNAAGAQQTGQTASVCNVGNSSMVAKGFTFALDKSALESAALTVQVASGAQVLATTNIPVKKFKYSGKKYFTETVSFGMLQGKDKNTHMVPTLKLAVELLSTGDNKVYIQNQTHFVDLEPARGEAGSHPLGMVR